MALRDALAENKDTVLRGVALLLGGAALLLVGSIVGGATSKLAMLSAGTLGVTGVIIMFLAFFVYLLPPMLPGR